MKLLLDTSVLGWACHPREHAEVRAWLRRAAGVHELLVSEVADYELRRELIRIGAVRSLARLDELGRELVYVPVTTATWRFAAKLWAVLQRNGVVTRQHTALASARAPRPGEVGAERHPSDTPGGWSLQPRRGTRGTTVPRISEFFGMTVYMYWFDVQKHHQPPFHVRFGGDEAVFSLDGTLLEGDIGQRARRLVAEWCSERPTELRDAWAHASCGKEIPWVAPLR